MGLNLFAQVETDFSNGGGVRVGDSTTACVAGINGAIRFDANSSDGGGLQYCNGSSWLTFLTGSLGAGVVNNGNSFSAPMVIGTNDNNTLAFETNGNTAMIIDTNGRVGVGASPNRIFTVEGDDNVLFVNDHSLNGNTAVNGLTLRRVHSAGTGGNGIGSGITFAAETTVESSIQTSGRIMATLTDATSGSADSALTFETANNSTVSEKMRIDSSGNVGIGTPAPSTKLDIYQTSASLNYDSSELVIKNSFAGVNAPAILFNRDDNGALVDNGEQLGSFVWKAYDGDQYSTSASIRAETDGNPGNNDVPGRLLFFTTPDNTNSPTEKMRIDSGGNIGIGTSSPGAELDVTGTGAIIVPDGTSAQRPTGQNGMIRYNSTTTKMEAYENGGWADLISAGGGGDLLNGGNAGAIVAGSNDNTLSLEANGNTAMIIDTAGDIGIGTTTVSAASSGTFIHLHDEGGDQASLRLTTDATGTGGTDGVTFGIWDNFDSDFWIWVYENKDIRFGTNSLERLVIEDSGNVGVGTDDPSHIFEVNGIAMFGTLDTNEVRLGATTNAAGHEGIGIYHDGTDGYIDVADGGSTWQDLYLRGSDVFIGNANQMVKLSNGNVGIGSTTPSDSLHVHVQSSTDGIRLTDQSSGHGIQFQADYPAMNFNRYWDGSDSRAIGDDYTGSFELNPYTGNFRLTTGNNPGAGNVTTLTERLSILNTGNVGIGSTSPEVELDVHTGSINAAEICDENNSNCKDISSGWSGGLAPVASNVVFKTRISSNQSIGGGTVTVDIGATDIDPNGYVDLANDWIQPTTAGYYSITASAHYQTLTASEYFSALVFHGDDCSGSPTWTEVSRGVTRSGGGQYTTATTTALVYLDGVDDCIQFRTNHSGGASEDLKADPGRTYIIGHLVSSATGDFLADGSVPMSGELELLSENSATDPDLTFNGDENTGIFQPAADQIAISNAGSETLRITAGGDVGIGTTAPDESLHIYGDGKQVMIESATQDTSSRPAIFFSNNNQGYFAGSDHDHQKLFICHSYFK